MTDDELIGKAVRHLKATREAYNRKCVALSMCQRAVESLATALAQEDEARVLLVLSEIEIPTAQEIKDLFTQINVARVQFERAQQEHDKVAL